MDYQRNWLEDSGSDDSHGRALWALGAVLNHSNIPALIVWPVGCLNRLYRRFFQLPARGPGHLRLLVFMNIYKNMEVTAERAMCGMNWPDGF